MIYTIVANAQLPESIVLDDVVAVPARATLDRESIRATPAPNLMNGRQLASTAYRERASSRDSIF
jgi:hypothetical protein